MCKDGGRKIRGETDGIHQKATDRYQVLTGTRRTTSTCKENHLLFFSGSHFSSPFAFQPETRRGEKIMRNNIHENLVDLLASSSRRSRYYERRRLIIFY